MRRLTQRHAKQHIVELLHEARRIGQLPTLGQHGLVKQDAKFDDWSSILFDQAMLAEGGQLIDPASFVKKLNDMLLGMALR